MHRIILDTNLLISFLISNSDFIKKIIELKKLKITEIYASELILEELTLTLQKPSVKKLLKVNSKKVAAFIAFYKYNISLCAPLNQVTICQDPKDNKFLELAREVQADYIISGDKDLLELKQFENTKILKPGEFIEVLHLDL